MITQLYISLLFVKYDLDQLTSTMDLIHKKDSYRVSHFSVILPSLALAPALKKPWLRLALFSVDPAIRHPPTCESLFSNRKQSYRSNSTLTGRQP